MAQETRTRAAELAAQVEAVNNAILDTVSATSDRQWQQATASEGWTVGVVAHHMSEVQGFVTQFLTGLAAGEASPVSVRGQDIEASNARHAQEFAGVGKPETLAALRENGATLVSRIRELDDEMLQRVHVAVDDQELTGTQVIELAVIGHFQDHLNSIRATAE